MILSNPTNTITITTHLPKKHSFLCFNTIPTSNSSSFLSFNRLGLIWNLRKSIEMSSKQPSSIILTSGASGRINALLSVRAWRTFVVMIHAVIMFLLFPFRGRKEKPSKDKGICNGTDVSTEGVGRYGSAGMRLAFPSDCGSESGGSSSSNGGGGVQRKTVRVPAKMVTWKSGEVGVRRGLAIKRVLEDEGVDCVREYFLFHSCRGDTLFAQSWTPVSAHIRGLVVLMHGLNEHSGRYDAFAKQLNANGLKVYGMDWIGHGGSDGLHAYVPSLNYAVTDLKSFLDKVLAENPGLPCFCFGHSTGGAIVLKAALDPKIEKCLSGVVLTSPAVGVQPSHPIFSLLAPVFSFLLPRFQLSAANKKGIAVSRDPAALVAKYSDPLVYTGAIRVRTGYEILRITRFLQRNLTKIKVPFLVLHGSADSVTDPTASQKLYDFASSSDKSIKLFDGLLHDLLFEPEREEITKDIIDWLNCRV